MIKCIATDMDGTLLNSNQEISEVTKQAIIAAEEKGIKFLLATGRSYPEVRRILDKSGIECPAICVNGAEIRDVEGNILQSIGLDGAVSAQITNVLENMGIYFELYTEEGTFTTDLEKGINVIVDILHSANPENDVATFRKEVNDGFEERLIHVVDDYSSIFEAKNCAVYKFLVFSMDEDELAEASKQLNEIAGIDVTSSGRHNLEINHIGAQKGIALKKYVEEKGISLEETMALGDNYNDLSMLEIAGYSVAMGNAEEEIKAASKYVTESNNDDGVAKAIMKALEKME